MDIIGHSIPPARYTNPATSGLLTRYSSGDS
jgi:hypothetical protein